MERAAALKVSTLLRVNPTPVAVRLTAAPPIDDERGLTVRSTGDTVNGVALEGAAPGVATVSGNVPERARSWEVIAACSWVELTYVVTSGAPAQFTTELGPKPAPVTITRKYAPPASTGLGESEAMAGAPRVELMVKVAVLDAPPYWLTSWMLAAPAAAIRLPGTDAVTVVSAGVVGARGRAVPLHHASRRTVGAGNRQREGRRTGCRRGGNDRGNRRKGGRDDAERLRQGAPRARGIAHQHRGGAGCPQRGGGNGRGQRSRTDVGRGEKRWLRSHAEAEHVATRESHAGRGDIDRQTASGRRGRADREKHRRHDERSIVGRGHTRGSDGERECTREGAEFGGDCRLKLGGTDIRRVQRGAGPIHHGGGSKAGSGHGNPEVGSPRIHRAGGKRRDGRHGQDAEGQRTGGSELEEGVYDLHAGGLGGAQQFRGNHGGECSGVHEVGGDDRLPGEGAPQQSVP